ncbi:phosphate ABC transporter, permease protein (DUF3333 domain) [Campylobacter blaseri]|nr:phosphate ABC transporter permease PstA [Campylobacter blaseri]QKF86933.1 phosphate ABC transporter, permease protein (DUF3333 domain) [Campylobacter blaseri]
MNDYFYSPLLAKRNKKAKRFKFIALLSLLTSIIFLLIFIADMIGKGHSAFRQTYVLVPVNITEKTKSYTHLAVDRKEYGFLVSRAWLRDLPNYIKQNPDVMDTFEKRWVLADDNVDQYFKGKYNTLNDKQKNVIENMKKNNEIKLEFNSLFFTKGDSKIPEYAGFLASMVGSVMTMLITMFIAVPIGIMSAIYLEEFAKPSKFTDFIDININNLAAIPSILFGMLGLAVFINFFGVPRSTPIAGGLVLALMSLPVIIVSSKAALKAVPDSIRQAGFGLGLTKWQITRDHTLPLAMPTILTGSIIALAQAMGETAPLIMIGMIAFIPDATFSFTQATTVMPAQIFVWGGMPERIYIEKTAAGILVLLSVLIILNALAIYLRKKYSVKW